MSPVIGYLPFSKQAGGPSQTHEIKMSHAVSSFALKGWRMMTGRGAGQKSFLCLLFHIPPITISSTTRLSFLLVNCRSAQHQSASEHWGGELGKGKTLCGAGRLGKMMRAVGQSCSKFRPDPLPFFKLYCSWLLLRNTMPQPDHRTAVGHVHVDSMMPHTANRR